MTLIRKNKIKSQNVENVMNIFPSYPRNVTNHSRIFVSPPKGYNHIKRY